MIRLPMSKVIYLRGLGFVSQTNLFLASMGALLVISFAGFATYIHSEKAALDAIINTMPVPYQKTYEDRVVDYILSVNPKLKPEVAMELSKSVIIEANRHKIPVNLVLGLIKVESRFEQYAISNHGALGFMQVMPVWHYDKIAKLSDKNIYSASTNTHVGVTVLGDCITKHKTVEKSLACYNGPIGKETLAYAKRVLAASPVTI